jgi:hypothetical protein
MSEKDKTIFKIQVETKDVLPRTLVVKPVKFQQGPAEMEFHQIFGGDNAEVWVATFFDIQEAQGWVQASVTFGRPVTGAVVPKAPTVQETPDARIIGGEQTGKAN